MNMNHSSKVKSPTVPIPSGKRPAPFTVGIDLGTTNCAVAYVENSSAGEIKIFRTLQLVSEGNLSSLPMLPSYLYLAGPHELMQENIRLPWDREITFVVGEFAKKLGASVPSRLVSSAKSWLCHAGVDRKAAILPWSGGKDLEKLSPVEASSRYLQHIRDAWNHEMAQGEPENQLQNQDVILTVPASFDEVARELTLDAALKAGLEKVTLLEEPQAAFYAWIATNRDSWHQYLHNGQIVVICDMGGGTTDFSLITVQEEGGKPVFTRVAVGDHLILGGDNIDMALARHIEVKLTGQAGKLDSGQWSMLCHGCRRAKEELLSEPYEHTSWPIVVQDRSSRLIGSTLKFDLSRELVKEIVENGFFPISRLEEEPVRSSRMGLQEWGLPYVQDTAVSRHLASFLRKHQASIRELREKTGQPDADLARPDAILFNGGALKPRFLQDRVVRIMEGWFPANHGQGSGEAENRWSPTVLFPEMGDLAVAYGAAYYGQVRQGKGIRISGGIGRSYYIGVGTEEQKDVGAQHTPRALCLVPRKMEEGQEVEIKDKEFVLLIGEPVSFPLYTSSTRLLDQAGDILPVTVSDVSMRPEPQEPEEPTESAKQEESQESAKGSETMDESFRLLPPIQTILRRGRAKHKKVPVHLRARLTEIGTLELWCVSREGDRQWRLQFGIREVKKQKAVSSLVEDLEPAAGEGEALDVEKVRPLLSSVFGDGAREPEAGKVTPDNLFKKMEEALDAPRQSWPIFTLRKMSEMLLEFAGQKGRSATQEARWLNLLGFCLRPGFGYPLDEWRIKNLWKVLPQGIKDMKDREVKNQTWILCRRVAGGLNQNHQMEIFRKIMPYLIPQKKAPAGPKPSLHELAEMWRLGASLERLDIKTKETMGSILLDRLSLGKSLPADLWALARIGARQPLYGSVHSVVPAETAEEWVVRLLKIQTLPRDEKTFALTQLARKTSDRARDIRDSVRDQLIAFFTQAREEALREDSRKHEVITLDQAIQSVIEVSHYQSREQSLVFGESLPKGLQLVTGGQ
ncbi:MAG: Hsp70 family protein [bacterium]